MFSYISRRLLYAVFVLFGVATVVFFIARITGDPVSIMLPPDATLEQEEQLKNSLGLDKPVMQQYVIFISNLLQLDFGTSLRYEGSTLNLILERMPATLQLGGAAMIFSLIIAVPAGILTAIKRGKFTEKIIMSSVIFLQSVPVFWVGILLILVFAVTFRLLPTGGVGTAWHLILPAIALGTHLLALVTRLLRASLIESLESDYVRTAKAKGLLPKKIVGKHAMRNSLLPVVTIVGLEIGALLGGSVVTETVFAWPGVGQLLILAIYNRDFPLVQAIIIILAGIFVIVNLLVDILYVVIDPRIKYS